MGQAASSYDPRFVRAWGTLEAMTTDKARLDALDMLLGSPEYIAAAKRVGIYADLLAWSAAKRRGQHYAWPRPYAAPPPLLAAPPPLARTVTTSMPSAPAITRAPAHHAPPSNYVETHTPRLTAAAVPKGGHELARIPAPKRALDFLTECYMLLGLDDSEPLTHEALRSAYKRKAVKAHPDRGGSKEMFDQVHRAYSYIEEVLNKLLPKSPSDKADPRFTMTVSPEEALRARGGYVPGATPAGGAAPTGSLTIEDAPQIALNPKKLDMALFNKLFDENKLVDPDTDGYGDWMKSADGRNDSSIGKVGKAGFNNAFTEAARRAAVAPAEELSKYRPPADLVLSPGFGTTIGSGRPEQYTKSLGTMLDGPGLAYTDLMHAYGSGSTFSQDVGNPELLNLPKEAPLPGRARSMADAEREYGGTPGAMTPEQSAAVRSFEMARQQAEAQRQQRAAARDVDIESQHARLKSRMMIRE